MIKKILFTATILSMATIASAQTTNLPATNNGWGVKTPLLDRVEGKFNITVNVGYVYNFASKWDRK